MNMPDFPEQDASLLLPGPVGQIEADIEFPDADVARRDIIAVLCHPLPTEGGSKDNKVVTMTGRALRELGITTLRFNFRGTGASTGSFDEGRGEREDLRAVFDWVKTQRPDARLWLGGFSFGSYVSLQMNAELSPEVLISIAPPAGRWDFDAVPVPQMPWLVVQGDADEIVDAAAVANWFAAQGAPRGALARLADTSHFFHRKLMDLRQVIQHWAQPLLEAGGDAAA